MNDIVIRAHHVTKVYRLYAGPGYRFLDMFGLLGKRPGAYTEHAALDGVDLEIRRGEKVAIIGRNGAGKSTLLKLITRVIEPSSGTLDVKGHAHALLQIGTGFHPDFTGRQNVLAYLAQLGVAGRQAAKKCDEIVDFAELEEYIDQPVKTYSSGMAVRLMFSAATAIVPDLLVLDEVLGVGDAYFAAKSYTRMGDLCSRDGTTLLLVTHDIYSAAKMCERVVWIDRGRVLMDGDASVVVKAYEDSVRQQEEVRLRAKTRDRLERRHKERPEAAPVTHLLVEMRARERRPQPSPVYFSRVELRAGGDVIAALPLGTDAFDESRGAHLVQEGTCWGEPSSWHGREARPFLNFGSPFHKVAGIFQIASSLEELQQRKASVSLEYWSDEPCELTLHLLSGGQECALNALPPSSGAWKAHEVDLTNAEPPSSPAVPAVQGTGRIMIDDVTVFDHHGNASHFLEHGRPASVALRFRVVDPTLREHAQVIVTFHREGVQTACRIITRELFFDGADRLPGTITLHLPNLVLGSGTYFVTIMVTAEGYFDQDQTVFYSINPGVYCCLNRVVEVTITGGGLIATGTAFVGQGVWTLVSGNSQECDADSRH
jgi:ABC-type polysaccharide/polyol phosphate transport system ATPase subunit